ncbi:hypothetical protein AMTR_s00010p00117170 [Amborella trichopoda]|uniref:Uncharacterized protein n=1 Tax=Amborella trichopoda TaxID=13333 RepID=W1NFW8_AMBTC|nr:hypothetical protein AMTR_s00010p00117170 [Amborella trichopoda]
MGEHWPVAGLAVKKVSLLFFVRQHRMPWLHAICLGALNFELRNHRQDCREISYRQNHTQGKEHRAGMEEEDGKCGLVQSSERR